jgi:hypothetical protein
MKNVVNKWARPPGSSHAHNGSPIGRQSLRTLLPVGDSPIREFQELRAATAHLDSDVAQGGALDLQTGRLSMIGTAHCFEFALGMLLKFLYRHPQSILA